MTFFLFICANIYGLFLGFKQDRSVLEVKSRGFQIIILLIFIFTDSFAWLASLSALTPLNRWTVSGLQSKKSTRRWAAGVFPEEWVCMHESVISNLMQLTARQKYLDDIWKLRTAKGAARLSFRDWVLTSDPPSQVCLRLPLCVSMYSKMLSWETSWPFIHQAFPMSSQHVHLLERPKYWSAAKVCIKWDQRSTYWISYSEFKCIPKIFLNSLDSDQTQEAMHIRSSLLLRLSVCVSWFIRTHLNNDMGITLVLRHKHVSWVLILK